MRFKDQVKGGGRLAEIHLVPKIVYPEEDDDPDSGTLACSCALF